MREKFDQDSHWFLGVTFARRQTKTCQIPETCLIPHALALLWQTLEASDNDIEYLPVGVGKLSNLVNLDIRRNGCLRPPKGTQDKGPVAVVEYLERSVWTTLCLSPPAVS